ncbi:uncharacterized protein LOC128251574 [Octopus bimaculoides]|uniref:uncharacterized protein LOC128251574 n=1 Tax=Octopus bimaculoides TaxID=37653 RepID=UPI0022E8D034|nr:uncharacterized protein LOC128251574 [Octopus bimaculoides]
MTMANINTATTEIKHTAYITIIIDADLYISMLNSVKIAAVVRRYNLRRCFHGHHHTYNTQPKVHRNHQTFLIPFDVQEYVSPDDPLLNTWNIHILYRTLQRPKDKKGAGSYSNILNPTSEHLAGIDFIETRKMKG